MATFTIPGTQIQANIETDSASQTLLADIASATVTLVDTNNQWGSVIDNTRHIQCWGIQISRDGGTTWNWWLFSGDSHNSPVLAEGNTQPLPADASLWIPFGFRDRSGGMPRIKVEYSAAQEAIGARVRLAILTDAQVRLGAQIIVS